MKVLGVSGSPRIGMTTDRLVQEVLNGCDCETEFIALSGRRIGPCIACLGCAETNVCVLKDDMAPLRQRIVEADAYVFGAANYFNLLNGLMHCFLERFYQFRHREGAAVTGKLAVAVGVGGGMPDVPAKCIETFCQYNKIEMVGHVSATGPASCFTCGFGETCKVGAIQMFFGEGTKITDDIIPDLAKQPDAIEAARELGAALVARLRQGAQGT